MQRDEPPKENTRILSRHNILSLYLPAVILSLGTGIATPALPVFAKSFDISVTEASQIFTVHMVGGILITFPTGYLMDRIGRRKVALSGPILVALFSFLVAIAQSYQELLVYRFLGGAAQQIWMLSRLAIIADTGGKGQRGRQITGMVGMEMTGRFMAPAIGGFIAAASDIRMPFVVHGILSLLAILPSFVLLKETAPQAPAKGGAAASDGARTATQVGLAALLVLPVLMFFFAQFTASVTRGTLFSGAVQLYPVYVYGVGPEAIGVLGTIAGVLGIPIVFSTGAIMDKFGRKTTVVPGFLLLAASLAVLAWIATSGLGFEAYSVAYLAMHMAINITSGNMQVIGSDIAPPHLRGKFFGIWRMIGEIGTAISPVLFGFVAETNGYSAAFGILCGSALVTAVVLIFFVQDPSKGRPRSEPAAEPSPAPAAVAAPPAR